MSGEEDVPEKIYFWLRFVLTAAAVIGVFHRTILVIVSALLLGTKTIPEQPVDGGEFVERKELQKEFLKAISSADSETVLVYGERDGGKTSLVRHALKNRRAVISVLIQDITHKGAQDEMIEKLSRELNVFKVSQSSKYVEDVFSWCRVQPVVVISLEAKCGGDALDGIITASKILSYENRYKGHPRIVVDMSGSRAAIEAGIQLTKRRVIGVHVGFFSRDEALSYVKERVPKSFKDPLRRQDIAQSIVDKFDCHVLKLKRLCELLETKQPSEKSEALEILLEQFCLEMRQALGGWDSFCQNVETGIDSSLSDDCWRKVVHLLLKGRQEARTITDILKKESPKRITQKDIGLANADAPYHPLSMDPFGTTLSLAGKAVVAVLTETYKAGAA